MNVTDLNKTQTLLVPFKRSGAICKRLVYIIRAINISSRIRTIYNASRSQANRSVATQFAKIARQPYDVRTTIVRLSYGPYEIAGYG